MHSSIPEVTVESGINIDDLENKQNYMLHIKGINGDGYKSQEVTHSFFALLAENYSLDTTVSVCDGFMNKGTTYHETQIAIDSMKNVFGGDSILTLNLTVLKQNCNPDGIYDVNNPQMTICSNPAKNLIKVDCEYKIRSLKLMTLSGSIPEIKEIGA